MWRDRLQVRLRPLLAPRWAAGQSWRACRRGDKIRWCQWIESDPSRRFAIPSASAGPAGLVQTPLVVRLHVRSESRRVGASRCRKSDPLEKFHEPGSECLTGLVDQAVTAQPAQVFMNADKAERPRPRRSELRKSWQRQREELSSHDLEAPLGRTPHAYAQRQERSPLTIL